MGSLEKFAHDGSVKYSPRAKIGLASLFWSNHSLKLGEGRSFGDTGQKTLYTFIEVK